MAVGAYVLSTADRHKGEPDRQVAGARVLALLGPQPRTLIELLALTGWSDRFLESILEELQRFEFVQTVDGKLALTDMGIKARFVAAT